MSRASRKANRESSRRAHNAPERADKGKMYFNSTTSNDKKAELLKILKERQGSKES